MFRDPAAPVPLESSDRDPVPSGSPDAATTPAERRLRAAAWAILLALGAANAWAYRHILSPDGVSYLDVAETYARDGWWAGLNGCWSPLYSWLLVPLVGWAKPGPAVETTAVHALNIMVFALALAAFELLLRELSRSCAALRDPDSRVRAAWRCVAYGAFGWGCLRLVSPALVTPDLMVAAMTFLSTALLLRVWRTGAGTGAMLAVGTVAGTAFLAKSAMFPVGFVTIAVAAAAAREQGGWKAVTRAAALGLLAFGLVAGPFAISLSIARGRPTFGDAGRLNYAWKVNGVTEYAHWQGGDGFGAPQHRPRRVLADPPVYEFVGPLPGTYPLWYDPSYWYEGVRPRADLPATARAVVRNLALLALRSAGIVLPLGLLLAGSYALGWLRPARWAFWVPFVPLAATVALYAMVYLIDRYAGAQLAVLLVAALAGSVPTRRAPGWITRGMPYATGAVLLANLAWWQTGTIALAARGGMPDIGGDAARELHALGVPQGAKVGVIGSGLTAFWARSARVHIVAEAPDARRFWAAPPAEQTATLSALRAAGVAAVIADDAPGCERRPGWRPIGLNSCAWTGRIDPPPTPREPGR